LPHNAHLPLEPKMPALSEATINALDDFLHERCVDTDGLVNVEMLDGFMCAVAITPGGIPEDEWMTGITGEGFKFASRDEADRVRGLLAAFRADAERRVRVDPDEPGDEDYPLLALPPNLDELDPQDTEEFLGLGWAIGFYRALDLRPDIWDQLSEELEGLDDDLDQLSELMMIGENEESSPAITLERRMEIVGTIPVFLGSFYAATHDD
jgi:yecA family protein